MKIGRKTLFPIEIIKKVKNGTFYLGGSIIGLLLSLITFPIYSQYLSKEDFGLLGYFNSISAFLIPIFLLQLPRYYLMVYFRNNSHKNKLLLYNTVFYLSIWNLLLSIFFLIIGSIIFRNLGISYDFFPYSIFLIIQVFFGLYLTFILQQYRIRKKGLYYFLLAIVAPILNALFSIIFIVSFNFGVKGRYAGIALSSLVTGVISIILLRKFTIRNLSFKEFFSSVKTMAPMLLGVLFYMPVESIDRILLERLQMPGKLGLYSIGMQISGYFLIAATALFKAFEPDFYNAVIKGKNSVLYKYIFQFIIIIIIGFTVYYLSIDKIIFLLTKGKFTEAGYYTKHLLWARLISSIALISTAILMALKKIKQNAYILYIVGFLSIVTYSIGINKFGYNGALFIRIIIPLLTLFIGLVFIYFNKRTAKIKES